MRKPPVETSLVAAETRQKCNSSSKKLSSAGLHRNQTSLHHEISLHPQSSSLVGTTAFLCSLPDSDLLGRQQQSFSYIFLPFSFSVPVGLDEIALFILLNFLQSQDAVSVRNQLSHNSLGCSRCLPEAPTKKNSHVLLSASTSLHVLRPPQILRVLWNAVHISTRTIKRIPEN